MRAISALWKRHRSNDHIQLATKTSKLDLPAGTSQLTCTFHCFINFANQTYQWVDVQRFRLPDEISDDVIALTALIKNPKFGDNYATDGSDPERHGPYWRDRITPASYNMTTADEAERLLRLWAEKFAPLPEHARADLARNVYQPLRAANRVYQLRDLGSEAFHDWGGVHDQFNEFVLFDRTNKTLTLIVATDD